MQSLSMFYQVGAQVYQVELSLEKKNIKRVFVACFSQHLFFLLLKRKHGTNSTILRNI